MFILAALSSIDWGILFGYMALIVLIGALASRRKTDAAGYFLGGRSMPTWAVALSIIATTLSVATFTGAPQISFKGDLTYLSLNIGGMVAVLIVATLFVPRLYRAGTITIYGFIEQRLGPSARLATSCTFLLGRLIGSGARLFIAAIPVCLLVYGETNPSTAQLLSAIALVGIVGTAYTVSGGIRAVIWTDTAQIIIVMGSALATILLLLHWIPLSIPEIVGVLSEPAVGAPNGKLDLLDTSFNTTAPFTLWTALIGATVLNMAAYGVDHDLAQRMLTAKSPLRGSVALIAAQLLGILVVSLFLVIGLLLFIYYKRPDIMGAAAPADAAGASFQIYPQFLLHHMPAGLAGLAMAGLFAAAQGSLDSAINAMASSAVVDIYWPLRRRLGLPRDASSRTPRVAVMITGAVLIAFAIVCALRYDPRQDTLLEYALGVLAFAWSGMLAVFLTALFTRRGSSASIIAGLITGILVTTLLQPGIYGWITNLLMGAPHKLANFWWMPIATAASFLVCIAGKARCDEVPEPRGFDVVPARVQPIATA